MIIERLDNNIMRKFDAPQEGLVHSLASCLCLAGPVLAVTRMDDGDFRATTTGKA